MNRSDGFVQRAPYHSCHIKCDGNASFRRSDTVAVLIGDIVRTEYSWFQ